MPKKLFGWAVAGLLLAGVAGSSPALAAEHPTDLAKAEQAGPAGETKAAGVTMAELSAAIQEFIKKESDKDGHFVFPDDMTGKTYDLKLEKVHEEKLSRLGKDEYFACADFAAKDGTKVDLDIFMRGESKEKLQASEVYLHKVNGKERYTWMEKDGVWSRKPVPGGELPKGSGPKGKDKEHPAGGHEHPSSEPSKH